jgi:hypothetical protein
VPPRTPGRAAPRGERGGSARSLIGLATCIDLPNTTRLPFDYEAGTAPVTVDLIHQSNAACALQRVQGRFEFQDWLNGTLLMAGAGGNWDLTLGPRKRGRGVCLI